MDRPTSAAPVSTSAGVANRNPATVIAAAAATTTTTTPAGTAGVPAFRRAPRWRGGSVVLGHPLRAVGQLLRPQPLVVRQSVATPPHYLVLDPTDLLEVEQQLHLVLALLSRVRHRARSRRVVGPRVEGL
jgi:hypothetical protein